MVLERSQIRGTYYMIPFIWYSGKLQGPRIHQFPAPPPKKKNRSVIARGWAMGKGLSAKGQHEGGFFFGGGHMIGLFCVSIVVVVI